MYLSAGNTTIEVKGQNFFVPPINVVNTYLKGDASELLRCLFVRSGAFGDFTDLSDKLQRELVQYPARYLGLGTQGVCCSLSLWLGCTKPRCCVDVSVECRTPPRDHQYNWDVYVSFNGATQNVQANYQGRRHFIFEPCPPGQYVSSFLYSHVVPFLCVCVCVCIHDVLAQVRPCLLCSM